MWDDMGDLGNPYWRETRLENNVQSLDRESHGEMFVAQLSSALDRDRGREY